MSEVTHWFDVSQPAVSRHLKILEESGWIERSRDGKTRPCRLSDSALYLVDAYLGRLRTAIESNYDRLDAILVEKSKDKNKRRKNNE